MEIDLLDGALLRQRPVPHVRLDAGQRPGVLGRRQRAVGHLPLRRHRRDREAQGRLRQLEHDQGRLPAQHPGRPLDHRPRRPQHAERRNLVSRRFTPRAVTRWEDHVQRDGRRRWSTPRLAKGRVERGRGPGRTVAGPDDRLPAGFPDEALARAQGVVGAHHPPRRRAPVPRRRRHRRRLRVRGGHRRALRGQEGLPGRRRHVLLPRGRGTRSKHQALRHRRDHLRLRCSSSTVAPRRRAPSSPAPSSVWPTTPTSGSRSRPGPTSTWPSKSSSARSRRS